MQIESFVLLGEKDEILFSINALKSTKSWETYLEEVKQLIYDKKGANKLPQQIYSYDNVVVAIRDLKPMKILVTIPNSSVAQVEPSINMILNQIEKIITHCSDGVISQETLTERDHYIRLRMIFQNEFSANGYMRFIPESDFAEIQEF